MEDLMIKFFKSKPMKKYEGELAMMLVNNAERSKKLVTEAVSKEDAYRLLFNKALTALSERKFIATGDSMIATNHVLHWNLHGVKEID
jgi:hypothetical protein